MEMLYKNMERYAKIKFKEMFNDSIPQALFRGSLASGVRLASSGHHFRFTDMVIEKCSSAIQW